MLLQHFRLKTWVNFETEKPHFELPEKRISKKLEITSCPSNHFWNSVPSLRIIIGKKSNISLKRCHDSRKICVNCNTKIIFRDSVSNGYICTTLKPQRRSNDLRKRIAYSSIFYVFSSAKTGCACKVIRYFFLIFIEKRKVSKLLHLLEWI